MPWQEVTDPAEIAAAQATLAGKGGDTAPSGGLMDRKTRLQLQASGLPVLSETRDPYARLTDPKQRAMAQRQMLAAGQATITKGSDAVKGAEQQLAGLSEFEALNNKNVTGGIGGWLQSKLPSWAQTDEAQRVEQLSTGMARGNRIPGEGTISDFDARQFARMTGGLDKSPAANAAYIAAAKAAQKAQLERQAFNEAFLQANGTTVGADTLWKQYATANPLFDPKGGFRGQRKSWGDYFASRAQTALAGGNPDARPATKPSGNAPMKGQVVKGYRFKGGNPADRNSWEPAK